MKNLIGILVVALLATEGLAAKRDFKGLFGSYRREKFVENEARSGAFGVDLMLSTLLPFSPLMKSSEVRPATYQSLAFSTFFNVELGVHYSLTYNWLVFANLGYYNYETRKENTVSQSNPLFHHFELEAFPILAGLKYRFGSDDIVPYVGAGAGFAITRRKGYYDSSPNSFIQDRSNALVANAMLGVEFYFHPSMGIRLETSAYYMKLEAKEYDSNGTPAILPLLQLQGSTWAMRYASGLFYLF